MKKLIMLSLILYSNILWGQVDSQNFKTLNDTNFVKGDIIKIPELLFSLSMPLNHNTIDSLIPVVIFLRNHPNLTVEMLFHTDLRGNAESNYSLSNFRGKAVWQYLIMEQGLDSTKLKYRGCGETLPIISYQQIQNALNDQEREKLSAINRRTELLVIDIE